MCKFVKVGGESSNVLLSGCAMVNDGYFFLIFRWCMGFRLQYVCTMFVRLSLSNFSAPFATLRTRPLRSRCKRTAIVVEEIYDKQTSNLGEI